MSHDAATDVTRCLLRLRDGDTNASAELLSHLYDELRAIAEACFRRERPDHTLQPTALVHEAYIKLVNQKEANWNDKTHFLAVAAEAIRRILIDHARKHGAAKRTPPTLVTLDFESGDIGQREADVEALDAALSRLSELNQRQAKVVEMRFFAGMTVEEVASVLDVSPNTVKGDWRIARAWLQRELERGGFA
ncbi:MAG TPA: sigma-70 family RNA polymerase sigma factor [Phycisphaerae bacterium]|nr:sigma-70 family RNA polymerase sigma factor [Phycisphaerae bacterium]HRW52375.1 sigma-70 family RNA polymerase sigma factor [Phycisphaerae bacterium]